jgi:Cft2 family RNA processing exonuclease
MTIDIEVIPISNDSEVFHCSILRIGSIRILLDCGWTEQMDVFQYSDLPPSLFSQIDAVLLSHYTLNHVGALPYLMFRSLGKKLRILGDMAGGALPRVIATEAVRRLGELSLASLHEDLDKVKTPSVSDDSYALSVEDIVTAFACVQPVQFNECVEITSRDGSVKVTITAQPAGKLIGGAYFVITVGSQRIVYAVDYAMQAGQAVAGLGIGPARSPSVLITDSAPRPLKNGDVLQPSSLMSCIKQTVRGGGNVLIPVDATGDVLELVLLIESAYNQDAALQVYPVVFVSPLGDVVLDQVKTRMEWMSHHVLNEFEQSQNFTAHPFLLQHVQLCSGLHEYFEKHTNAKIVISTSAFLDFGDSRELFARFSNDSNNLVILTQSPLQGSLAERALAGASEVTVSQYVKTPLSDEQLRQVYREALEKEAQDDELRRRRLRERTPQQLSAPSSAAAVPVDLIRGVGNLEGDSTGNFFRPQLFAAQTVASGAVLNLQKQVSDYGEALNNIEIDTWRAHAEMSDVGAAREAAAEMVAAQVKSEKIKGEMRIKGDISEESTKVKGELGVINTGESFDWRRDLQVRFGEPQKVEVRERSIKISCRIKSLSFFNSSRREFIASVRPMSLVMLPTRNLYDLQSVSLMMRSEGRNFVSTQEDIVPPLGDVEVEPPIPVSVSLDIHAAKKWVHIDPSLVMELPFKGLVDSEVRLARLSNTNIVGPLAPSPDTIQVPSGDFIEYAVTTGKRKRQDSNSLLVSGTPFRLSEFSNLLRANLPAASSVEFVSTEIGRALAITALGGNVVVTAALQGKAGECPVVEIMGNPSPCFYRVRELLYSSRVAV